MREPARVKIILEEKDKIENLKRYIASAEESLEAAKKALFELTGEELTTKKSEKIPKAALANLKVAEGGKVIEGIFDGENMVGPEGKVYPVPANYASKSKLVEGDKLKLTVAEDGSFIFKQIGPTERKKIIGTLNFEDNVYHVLAEGKTYNVLYASVTYFKAKPGDRVTVVVPGTGDSDWACLENVIHEVKEDTKVEPEENLFQEDPKGEAEPLFNNNQPPVPKPAPNPIVDIKPTPSTGPASELEI